MTNNYGVKDMKDLHPHLPKGSITEIASKLGYNRATVTRNLKSGPIMHPIRVLAWKIIYAKREVAEELILEHENLIRKYIGENVLSGHTAKTDAA